MFMIKAPSSHSLIHTFYMISAMRTFSRAKEFSIRKRQINTHLLCFITKGQGTLFLNDCGYPFHALQMFYLVPGMTIEAVSHSVEMECYILELEAVSFCKEMGDWKVAADHEPEQLLPPGPLSLYSPNQALWKMEQIAKSVRENEEKRKHLQLQDLLYFLMENKEEAQKEEHRGNGIELSISYMLNHLQAKISLETLASIASLTPNAYCRSFKRATGLSPIDYLNRIRIEDAKKQLERNRPVKEIAESIGFKNQYYFSRLFKKAVGIPPAVYMKRNHLRIAVVSYLDIGHNLLSFGVEPIYTCSLFQFVDKPSGDSASSQALLLERLRQARPELIIGDFFHSDYYDQLKQIAPTVIIPYNGDWRVLHMKLAELTNRENEATNTFKQLERKAAMAKRILYERNRRDDVMIMYLQQDRLRIQGAVNHPLSQLTYGELELNPAELVPLNKKRHDFEPNQIPKLPQGNQLFVHLWGTKQEYPYWEEFRDRADLKNIRYISDWLTMSWTPNGRRQIIDELLHLISENVMKE